LGNCTSLLASGASCQPVCLNGYQATGHTTCTAGTLIPALCLWISPTLAPPPTPVPTGNGSALGGSAAYAEDEDLEDGVISADTNRGLVTDPAKEDFSVELLIAAASLAFLFLAIGVFLSRSSSKIITERVVVAAGAASDKSDSSEDDEVEDIEEAITPEGMSPRNRDGLLEEQMRPGASRNQVAPGPSRAPEDLLRLISNATADAEQVNSRMNAARAIAAQKLVEARLRKQARASERPIPGNET